MKLPVVMPANLRNLANKLEKDYPNRTALLLSPVGYVHPKELPYALDNGRYPVWARGKEWREDSFWYLLEWAKKLNQTPLWIVIPDVVTDAEKTFIWWKQWYPVLKPYNWPLALAVQDGMTTKDVLSLRPIPDVIFIGGTTRWKWRNLRSWCKTFPRVHVGRVNTKRMLWMVHRAGAESSDGTGWWHKKQLRGLRQYLERSGKGLGETNAEGFFQESEL